MCSGYGFWYGSLSWDSKIPRVQTIIAFPIWVDELWPKAQILFKNNGHSRRVRSQSLDAPGQKECALQRSPHTDFPSMERWKAGEVDIENSRARRLVRVAEVDSKEAQTCQCPRTEPRVGL